MNLFEAYKSTFDCLHLIFGIIVSFDNVKTNMVKSYSIPNPLTYASRIITD